MYHYHDSKVFYLADREKYPNKFKAIWVDLSLKKQNSFYLGGGWIIVSLLGLLFSNFHPDQGSRFIGFFVFGQGLCFLFILGWVRYYSFIRFIQNELHVCFWKFTYLKFKITDVIEIRRLTNWGGSLRVIVRRTNGRLASFYIFSDRIPEFLSDAKVAEGLYFNKMVDESVISEKF